MATYIKFAATLKQKINRPCLNDSSKKKEKRRKYSINIQAKEAQRVDEAVEERILNKLCQN